MKRFFSMLVSLVLFLSLFGSVALAELSPDTKATISMVTYYSDDIVDGWIEVFNQKYPNITVEHESCGDVGVMMEKLQAQLMNGTAPDMYLCVAENRNYLTADGYIVDLTDLPIAEKVSESAKKQIMYQDRLYAICTGGSVGGIMVNLDLAKEAGITEEPATWADLVDAMQKFAEIGVTPFADLDDAAFMLLTAMYGAEYMDNDPKWMERIASGEKTHAEYWQPILERYKRDIIDNGFVTLETAGVPQEKKISNFALGKTGMMIGASWMFSDLDGINPDLNFEFWGIPNEDGSSKYYFGDCLEPSIAVNAQSEHKEESIAFLESLFEDDSLRSFEELNGFIACVDGYESMYLSNPRMSKAIEQGLNAGKQFMPQTIWDKNVESLRQYYVTVVSAMLHGEDVAQLAAGFDTVYNQQ